ncbi:hypothetical protein TrRE_jg912, partial [Triparma retinervis]
MKSLPSYLPFTISPGAYTSTFLLATVAGNIAHMFASPSTPVLGASGGICGLYGLLWCVLRSAGRKEESKGVLKSMGYVLLMGYFYRSSVSNASHIGGFVGGVAAGWAWGPRFKKRYRSKRDPGDRSSGRSRPAVVALAGGKE